MFAAAFGILLSSGQAHAWDTAICLKNATPSDKEILIEEVDNFDWAGVDRPDHNWHGTSVKAGETRCEREITNNNARNVRFVFVIGGVRSEMKFIFENDILRYEADDVWGVRTNKQPSAPLRGRFTSSADPNFSFGEHCTGALLTVNCGIFTITGP